MYKLVVLFALLACAAAAPGYLAAPAALHAAPVVAAPAVAVAHTVPVATSYANTYKVSVKSPLVAAPAIAYTAPVVKTAPFVAAAPFVAHAAPVAYAAHAPVVALQVISVLASIASVQCGAILTPVLGKLVSEKVVESHGNNVVHASAPLVTASAPVLRYTDVALVQQPLAEVVQPVAKGSLIAEKTIEAHGHQVIHNAHPVITVAKPLAAIQSHVAIPTLAARELAYTAPIYYPYSHQLIGEKTVSNYGYSIQHLAGMPQYRSAPRYKLPSARSPRGRIHTWILKVSGERTAGIANDLGIPGLLSTVWRCKPHRIVRVILLGILVGLAWSAPAPAPKAAPAPKPLTLISELKTPASTTKLAPLIAPIAAPVIAPISRIAYSAPVLSQISPYAYAYSAPIAEIPSTYSIEQHGYHITY
ncbi:hypothetical protein DMN91_003719 [Ooceraea biroi]|uniref:Cuticle protein n=1 Tax=Ooceraea biroi TaxID=2015173 RepID=A0A3L8DSX8_OOCBI|nr:hypothetical protein DMN91_003719 [Ooceraea biroi]